MLVFYAEIGKKLFLLRSEDKNHTIFTRLWETVREVEYYYSSEFTQGEETLPLNESENQ